MNIRGLFIAEAGLRPANFTRRRRAFWSTVVAAIVAMVLVVMAVRSPSWLLVVAAIVAGLEMVLAWLARVVYGWLRPTPARMLAVRLVRWGPIGLFAAGGVAIVILAAAGVPGSTSLGLFVMVAMMIASGAAGIAGATN